MEGRELPQDVLLIVFEFLDSLDGPSNSLWPCALVCRHWMRPALEVLSRSVCLREPDCLAKFYTSLTSSKSTTAGAVRSLTLALSPLYPVPEGLIEDCLAHTIHVECLTISRFCLCNNLVVQRICFMLPKLRSLTFDDASQAEMGESIRSCFFDPHLLLDLPNTLTELNISNPSRSLLKLLPKILANLQRPRLTTAIPHEALPGSNESAKEHPKSMTGLKSFRLDLQPGTWGVDHRDIAKIGPSLTRTLTKFVFESSPDRDTSPLVEFLAMTPLLQKLELIDINFNLLFKRLQPLVHLRSLKMRIYKGVSFDVHEVSQSMPLFLRHSPDLDTIDVTGDKTHKLPVPRLVDAVLDSTTPSRSASRLRWLCFRHFKTSSVDTLQYLLKSAPLLQYLEIGLPKGSLACVARDLDRLKDIVNS